MKPYIIGLTGGIASGKTAAGRVFERLGAKIIDADVVSREVVKAGSEGFDRLKELFPDCITDGELDRARLKSIVFSDKEKLGLLNAATWELIGREISRRISELSESDVAVLIVPLLFESGLWRLADAVVTVSADESLRLKRVTERDGVSEETALSIIRSQTDENERVKRSDYVLDGNGDVTALEKSAAELYGEITRRKIRRSDS